MLAQSFQSAADIGINEIEFEALRTVLGMLERGELVHGKYPMASMFRRPNEFNMGATLDETSACGSIGCICGWAHVVSGHQAFADFFNYKGDDTSEIINAMPVNLRRLFRFGAQLGALADIQPEQAARAIRNYLTIGDAKWHEAVSA